MKPKQAFDFICFIVLIFLLFVFKDSFAQESNIMDMCKMITLQKNKHYMLLDEDNNLINGDITLGNLNVPASSDEGFITNKKLRIILYPKDLTLSSLDGQVISENFKKVKSQCPLTSEYLISLGLYPPRMGPGKFDVDMHIELYAPRSNDPAPEETITQKVTGVLLMPWINLQNSPSHKIELKSFLNGIVDPNFHTVN